MWYVCWYSNMVFCSAFLYLVISYDNIIPDSRTLRVQPLLLPVLCVPPKRWSIDPPMAGDNSFLLKTWELLGVHVRWSIHWSWGILGDFYPNEWFWGILGHRIPWLLGVRFETVNNECRSSVSRTNICIKIAHDTPQSHNWSFSWQYRNAPVLWLWGTPFRDISKWNWGYDWVVWCWKSDDLLTLRGRRVS